MIGPVGSTDTSHILDRVNATVLFKRQSYNAAAADFVEQVTAAIQRRPRAAPGSTGTRSSRGTRSR